MSEDAAPARRYAGRSADERDADRRTRLLGAALDVMGTQGYFATTVEKVCTLAKVSTRHFYRQYESKDAAVADLYETLVTTAFTAVVESIEATQGTPFAERVAGALRAYLAPLVADPRVARVMLIEVTAATPTLEEMRLEFRDRLVGLVVTEGEAAVRRGETTDRDFRFLGLVLVGASTSTVYDWARRPDRGPSEVLQTALVELAVGLLTA